MGWRVKWVSSYGSDFNYDYQVSFRPEDVARGEVFYNYDMRDRRIDELGGMSVFCQDESGAIFHTYSTYARVGPQMRVSLGRDRHILARRAMPSGFCGSSRLSS